VFAGRNESRNFVYYLYERYITKWLRRLLPDNEAIMAMAVNYAGLLAFYLSIYVSVA
jgi:hypothetical protein